MPAASFRPILFAAAALSLAACQGFAPTAGAEASPAALAAAIASPSRTASNIERDRYRHPAETLAFFGVEADDTVVEIWPGGGWYTEILAPYLHAGGGHLIAAVPEGGSQAIVKMVERGPAFDAIGLRQFPSPDSGQWHGTNADIVLTFRNVHNWRMGYRRPDKQDYSLEAFRQMYAMLKPGGVLGVVDHRLPESASAERERTSGYIKTSTIRRLAEQAGFRFIASSKVNANPRDTTDWEDGVWTLPPTLALKDKERAKYLAIGESDRMTLKFVKPLR